MLTLRCRQADIVCNCFIAGVVVTGDKFIVASVVDIGDKHKVANISATFRKNSKWPQGAWRNWNVIKPEVENLLYKSKKTAARSAALTY